MAIRVHQLRKTEDHSPLSGSLRPTKTFNRAPPPIELKMAVSEDKILAWLKIEDPEGWERIFNIYKGNEPGPLSIQKPKKSMRQHGNIPSGLVSAETIKAALPLSKADDLTERSVEVKEASILKKFSKSSVERYFKSQLLKMEEKDDRPKPRIFCLQSFRFIENQGGMELHEYFEPLTKESYCNQPWIEKHKRKWVTVDQDLLMHRPAEEMGGTKVELVAESKRECVTDDQDLLIHRAAKEMDGTKVELVAESKRSEYFWMRPVYFIIAIAKKAFAFFLGNRSLPDKGEPSRRLPGKKEFPKVYSVVLFTTYERKERPKSKSSEYLLMRMIYFTIAIAKRFIEFFLRNKPLKPKSYIVMVPDKKQMVSHSKSGILGPPKEITKLSFEELNAFEEKVQAYYANPTRPLPLFPGLRKKIDKIIGNPTLEITQASTPTTNLLVARPPIPVETPIEINLVVSSTDQDEDLAF